MSRAHNIRCILLAQQAALLARYHDALDSLEIEDARQELLGNADMRAFGDVISALDRLDHGAYGQCTACGSGIDELLLVEQPARRCCIDCEVTAEHVVHRHLSERARIP